MITAEQQKSAIKTAAEYLRKANIIITPQEEASIEITDFGLSEFETTGLSLLMYVNTARVCAKELMMTPGQTCPEHRHPDFEGRQGKEETFRCRYGLVYLYVEGDAESSPSTQSPCAPDGSYTAMREIILRPGEQYTLLPNTKHWFKSGTEGAVVSEFSTNSRDEYDVFSDKRISRFADII